MTLDPRPHIDRLLLSQVERRLAKSQFRRHIRQFPARAALPEGVSVHVAVPRTMNEKFLWRKIFDRNPLFTTVSDKLALKDWVASLGLGIKTPPTLWAGTDAAQIPPGLLDGNVVIKANHGSGTNIFVRRDTEPPDTLVERANAMLRRDYGRRHYEWGYVGIPRRLIVEGLVTDGPVEDIKFYTFGRRIGRVHHIAGRFTEFSATRYDPVPDGTLVRNPEVTYVAPRLVDGPLPSTTERALALAAEIGAHFDHMRVDFLTDGHDLWLGELTVYNSGGFLPGLGHDPEAEIARLWDIRQSWFLRARHKNWRLQAYANALRRELEREVRARAAS